MQPITNSLLAFILLAVGIIAVTLILIFLGRRRSPKNHEFFLWAHRIAGYIFVALYLFICAFMLKKLTSSYTTLTPVNAIHAYIGITIFPLIIAKISIVRLFKQYYQRLSIYGIIIIILTYMTVTLSAGYFTLTTVGSQYTLLYDKGTPVKVNINMGHKVIQQRCSTCHSLERVYASVKTENDWRNYITRIRTKEPAILNDQEALQVLGYLVKNLGIDDTKMDVQIGMKIILGKCHRCHTIERIFTSKKTSADWIKTIELMRSFDPNLLNDSEARQVNYYLDKVLAGKGTEKRNPLN